ncbi:Conserved hypothetical protein [Geobacillus thermodenitrificans NG80-2]|uniref:Uncharacterized protein n=1 Tax=Geobacillus thermodenitrificans (strain NG80-2) TaxID=420246 RepID=A4IQ75_GEOTN|nr:Conserved hypothetical protein [Geobacillus thermodenitrificans NG80-2]
MKWTSGDVATYEKERDYIDTALVPLLPVAVGQGARRLASGGELVGLVATEVERQLRGRVFLLPPFVYFVDEQRDELLERLAICTNRLRQEGMEHVFYVTCDRTWQEGTEASRFWARFRPFRSRAWMSRISMNSSASRPLSCSAFSLTAGRKGRQSKVPRFAVCDIDLVQQLSYH